MNTIDILIEGYAKITSNGWDATSTTTLINCHSELDSESKKGEIPKQVRDHIKIIVDPGANRDLLYEELKKRSLQLEDIDMVFITHHHLDHAMNVGLFPNAKVIDEEAVYTQAVAVEGVKMLPDTDITVMATPGHEYAHASLVVPTKNGTVVVAGDAFWFEDGEQAKYIKDGQIVEKEKLLTKKDDFAEKMEELVSSRKIILVLADWIIPGHGKMFQNQPLAKVTK